ncbi:glycosyltransferase family 9 protein [Quadrisphaera sp. INWT6]|uniref:glycosyltransferase family 9 protein n=1 Tax=Quadrisphaera sp. INWT6 TaxID=2596917 RepID=UPI0018926848|nr:glycosyltransferase family 9 protein [Quadrisphaera sp. INWT6]MBF5082270.1 glycosyltransferase family 9 protein [Quadrisphaera sp. INWT6]
MTTAPAAATDPNGDPRRVLAVRLDSDGDVLMNGPAVAALRTGPGGGRAERVDLLASRGGAAAGRLLPEVDEVLVADVPWAGYHPPAPDAERLSALVELLRERHYDEVVVFTSFHQSPLPMAVVARLAGVPRVVGASEDYPGSLLDLRHRRVGDPDGTGGQHEAVASLGLVAATGRAVPADPRLALRRPLPALPDDLAVELGDDLGAGRCVVLHPGASVPARAPQPRVAAAAGAALAAAGWRVVVTGGPGERDLTAEVAAAAGGAAAGVVDAGGRTDLAQLAALLDAAAVVVVGNTGPAHLAAAVGTPVASLFSAVMPLERWAPFGVPVAVLGDLSAPCALSRAQVCPVAGHPCLEVAPQDVVDAVGELAAGRVEVHPPLAQRTPTLPGAAAGRGAAGGPAGAEQAL